MTIDIEALAAVLRDAAKAEILPRFRRLDEGMVRQKTEAIDLVTEADEAAERVITREARSSWRRTRWSSARRRWPPIRRCSASSRGADYAITVDPVDGTANFAAGLPLFAVMAAVVRQGRDRRRRSSTIRWATTG